MALPVIPECSYRGSRHAWIPAFAGMTILLLCSRLAIAASSPASCIVTIESVELKSASGQWIKVVSPDHQVDVVAQEPGLSFFNNGKVPPGRYVNFRINLSERIKASVLGEKGLVSIPVKFDKVISGEKIEIAGVTDLKKALMVNKGSFVGVWFSLDFQGTVQNENGSSIYFVPPDKVKEVTITIDDRTDIIDGPDVKVLF